MKRCAHLEGMDATHCRLHITLVVLIAGILGATLCSAAATPATQPATRPAGPRVWRCEDEEYIVFNALLKHLFVDHRETALTGDGGRIGGVGPVVDQVVLSARTLDLRLFQGAAHVAEEADELVEEGSDLDAPRLLKGCPEELCKAYRNINLKPAVLDGARLKVKGLEVILLEQDEYRWPEQPARSDSRVYDKYPRCQGVTLLSRVAISADGTMAAVSASTNRAFLFGYGYIYLLRKEPNGWKVVAEKLTWIS